MINVYKKEINLAEFSTLISFIKLFLTFNFLKKISLNVLTSGIEIIIAEIIVKKKNNTAL